MRWFDERVGLEIDVWSFEIDSVKNVYCIYRDGELAHIKICREKLVLIIRVTRKVAKDNEKIRIVLVLTYK